MQSEKVGCANGDQARRKYADQWGKRGRVQVIEEKR